MPELPEVQALAERLEEVVKGTSLRSVIPLQFSALKTVDPPPESLIGRTVTAVGRRGKYLTIDFSGPRMLIHFGQGGRLDVERPPKSTKPKGSVLRLTFEGPIAFLVKEYGTERRAGWWVVHPNDDGPMTVLGPEPFDDAFADLLLTSQDGRHIHTMLRDQRTVAGIGRGYADDALHRARLSPFRALKALDAVERTRLIESIREVLTEALALERERTGGLPTKLGDRFIIHRNAGTPCPRCSGDLRRVSYESHEIVYCATCQTDGKVLADRRMSRLLR